MLARLFRLSLIAALASLAGVVRPVVAQDPPPASEGEAAMLDAVMAAIRADDAATLTRLLDDGPALAAQRDASGLSPLSLAVYMQRPHLAEIVRVRRGTPDVFEAAVLGEADVVRAALAAGQDVDAFAPDGFTLLGLAVFFGHADLAAALIEACADPSLRANNPQNVGPIHAAVARRDVDTLEKLLLAGGDPNLPQSQGVTPLHDAAGSGAAAVVGLLLLFGADAEARDDKGRSAADHARERGHAALAERLEAGR